MTFAEKLNNALAASGMTRSELADKAGISRPMITNYLNGGYVAKQNNIYKLAKALNISESDLIEDGFTYSTDHNSTPSPTAPPLSQHDLDLLAAYNAAPPNAKQVVDLTLEPYMPSSSENEDAYA